MVSQSIHKLFLPSARKALTGAFTKHSQEHSQSPHKSTHKVFTKTFAKLSQTLSGGIHKSIHKDIRKSLTNSLARSAAICFRATPRARMRSSPARSAAIFSGQPPRARTRRRRREKKRTLISPHRSLSSNPFLTRITPLAEHFPVGGTKALTPQTSNEFTWLVRGNIFLSTGSDVTGSEGPRAQTVGPGGAESGGAQGVDL